MRKLSIGQIITTPQQRDAIHVAVAPVVAGIRLYPGDHVRIGEDGNATNHTDRPRVGIVDPFLTQPVERGESFWLFLFPNSVTNLRHDWAHPDFDTVKPAPSESEKWLRQFAEDCYMSYPRLLEAANLFLKYGEGYTINGHDTPERVFQDREEFWKHYEVVAGTPVQDKDQTFIGCSC